MAFAHERGGSTVDPSSPPLHNGYDEVAAKRIEKQLVELGARIGETKAKVGYLRGALPEGVSVELLDRISARADDSEADMARLMGEARKLMRGE